MRNTSPPPRGPGRPKGSLNSTTKQGKAILKRAFKSRGGEKAFQKWAADNPELFYSMWAQKMIASPLAYTDGDGQPASTPQTNVSISVNLELEAGKLLAAMNPEERDLAERAARLTLDVQRRLEDQNQRTPE